VHSQTRLGRPVVKQQGTNRFKDNLVFRLKKSVVLKNMCHLGTQVERDFRVAERAKYLKFRRQLSNAIHSQIIVPLQAMSGEMINGE